MNTSPQTTESDSLLIRRVGDVPAQAMDVQGVKDVFMRLLVSRADGAPTFAMRHFTVAPGGHTPRHEHNYEHEVLVLRGRGRTEYDGAFYDISAGDVLFVKPNRVHQFVNTGDETLEFICLVPVTHDCGKPTPGS